MEEHGVLDGPVRRVPVRRRLSGTRQRTQQLPAGTRQRTQQLPAQPSIQVWQ